MRINETLDDLLLVETSRRNTDLIAGIIFQKSELYGELFRLFARNEEPLSRRSAWVLDTVAEKYPKLIEPYINTIIELLPTFTHDGLKRHSMRILARSPLPCDSYLGDLINISFEWLLSPKEAVAVKVHCMEILYRVSQVEPEIKKELADTIEWRLNEESAGFKNRGQKMLKKLYHEIENPIKSP